MRGIAELNTGLLGIMSRHHQAPYCQGRTGYFKKSLLQLRLCQSLKDTDKQLKKFGQIRCLVREIIRLCILMKIGTKNFLALVYFLSLGLLLTLILNCFREIS